MTDDDIIARILTNEGGYQNDATDTGNRNAAGELVGTNMGITPADYERFFGRLPSVADMENLSHDDAVKMYQLFYLAPFAAITNIPFKSELVDFGVLCGVGAAVRALQEAVGTSPDGIIGLKTIDALAHISDQTAVERAVTEIRIERSVDVVLAAPAKRKYLTGWLKRALLMQATT